jgi:hypothetical protein
MLNHLSVLSRERGGEDPYRCRKALWERQHQAKIRQILEDDSIIVQSCTPYYTFTKKGALDLRKYPELRDMGVKAEYQEITDRTECFFPQYLPWVNVTKMVTYSRVVVVLVWLITLVRVYLAYRVR